MCATAIELSLMNVWWPLKEPEIIMHALTASNDDLLEVFPYDFTSFLIQMQAPPSPVMFSFIVLVLDPFTPSHNWGWNMMSPMSL